MDGRIGLTKTEKRYEDLTITDDFMFAKVMLNESLCRRFLEMVLHIKINKIVYYHDELSLKKFFHSKTVRLDVYLSDEKGTIYNVEMQNSKHTNLPKRSRYYQGMMDLNLLKPGDNYNKLNRSYIIFVCTFDLFGQGQHIYTFENRCTEKLNFVLPDEAVKVFINTKGVKADIDRELLDLLNFFNGELPTCEIAIEMQKEVDKVKKKEEWRAEYMKLLELEHQHYQEGIEDGIRYFLKQSMKYGVDMEMVIMDIMNEYDMTREQIKSIVDDSH